jgi:hypothetical protein
MTESTSWRAEAERRILLTQTGPLRIAVDAVSAAAGLWLLWEHHLAAGIAVVIVPPIVVAGIVALRGSAPGAASVEAQADSPAFQLLRLVGLALAAYAAWDGRAWLLAVGAVLYALGFARAVSRLRR